MSLLTEGPGSATRLVEVLAGADLGARLETGAARPAGAGLVQVTTGSVEHGFVSEPGPARWS